MAVWKDLLTNPPPVDGAVYFFRRLEGALPEIFGTVRLTSLDVLCGTSGDPAWSCPFSALTHWRPVVGAPLPNWPAEPTAHGPWYDPFWHPPGDAKPLWVRRWPSDTNPIPCLYRAALASYEMRSTGWQFPWFLFERWKSYNSS